MHSHPCGLAIHRGHVDGKRTRGAPHDETGTASIELIASIPVVVLALLVAAQIAVAGYALWAAGVAARAGARSVLTGKAARPAAENSLPPGLHGGLAVEDEAGGTVKVGVRIPRLLPVLPVARVYGSSSMGGR